MSDPSHIGEIAALLADYDNERDRAAFSRLWAEADKAVNRPTGMARVRAFDLRLALVVIDRLREAAEQEDSP